MISIFDSVQWHTTPTMNWTIKYEYQRNGADMQYRFYWKVWVAYNDGWYDYALNLQLFLDGTRHDVKIKDVVTGNYGWSYEGTTDWYTVKNKTTGTTSFYASIYNVNTASIKATSSTSGLTVSGAASVLGTIADFNLGDGKGFSKQTFIDYLLWRENRKKNHRHCKRRCCVTHGR